MSDERRRELIVERLEVVARAMEEIQTLNSRFQDDNLRRTATSSLFDFLDYQRRRFAEGHYRHQRSLSLEERRIALRNQHRMRIEAAGPRRAEEARQLAANRRVLSGIVTDYDASTKTAIVELPGGETIRGRTIGRGAPVGKVVVTIPLGSAIATIQSPEPGC